MELLLKGMLFGLTVSILAGPIFFMLIQIGIERGLRAGMALGFGVWLSDFSFIFGIYHGLNQVIDFTKTGALKNYLGVGGGVLLVFFGLSTLLTKPPTVKKDNILPASYLSLCIKGFLVNTINPFTLFFWLGIFSTTVTKDSLSEREIYIFIGGLLGAIIISDTLKVVLAKRISRYIKDAHILLLRRLSGVGLLGFGLFLLWQVGMGWVN
jgi:threonine/homoserine/homoserine lactone efflux protein